MTRGPSPKLAGAMTRYAMRQDGLDPDDPAHVAQHERDLDLACGRRAVEGLARRGVDLGQPDDEELVDLGRAYRPVELALVLDRIAHERAPTSTWPDNCSCLGCQLRRQREVPDPNPALSTEERNGQDRRRASPRSRPRFSNREKRTSPGAGQPG